MDQFRDRPSPKISPSALDYGYASLAQHDVRGVRVRQIRDMGVSRPSDRFVNALLLGSLGLECNLAESTCGLSHFFGELAAEVPDGPPGYPDFIFHAGVLPEPPASLTTDRIVFRKALHDYNGWYRPDALWMYLTASKCRELGLFLLAAGFHGPRKMTSLAISHPDSAIRRICIFESELRLDDPPTGLTMAPFALRYYPAETREHPWAADRDTRDLPVLALSNADDSVGPTEDDWAKRDTIWIEPTPGMFRLAELLLNAGCSWNSVREYSLEGDAGYRGVGPMSAELKVFLPGSDGWIFPSEDVPNTNQPSL